MERPLAAQHNALPLGPEDAARVADRRRAVKSARGEKISTVVARMIAADIAHRRLAPGSPLPTEQQMATQFGVGRPSVREGLRLLEAQGLVTIRPGQGGGPVVGVGSGPELGRTLSLFLQMRQVTFRDATEAAAVLGGLFAGMAAARVANGDDSSVSDLITASRLDVAGSTDGQYLNAGFGFHEIIGRMIENQTLTLISDALSYLYTTRTSESHQGHWDKAERERTRSEHIQIANAIRRGAVAKAQQLNEEHLRGELRYIDQITPGLLDELLDWA